MLYFFISKKTSSKIKKKVELDNHSVVFMRSLAAGKRYKCTSVCLLERRGQLLLGQKNLIIKFFCELLLLVVMIANVFKPNLLCNKTTFFCQGSISSYIA